jgi:predicted MFS family arabinose efflux permease
MNKIKQRLNESAAARWTVLILVSLTMLTGYIVSDVMSPLKTMLEQQAGWSSSDFSIYLFGYGIFNLFAFMLIFGGMMLDRLGPRLTGVIATILMLVGTAIQYWAVSTDLSAAAPIFNIKAQVFWAMIGFGVFGTGIEMFGITANKVVVKWFTGRSLALALGLNVAAGRIGTALAGLAPIPLAKHFGNIGAPLAACLILLIIGLLIFFVYAMIDARADRENASSGESSTETDFKFADIVSIVKIRAFWYITLLCLLFYSAVFPFLKFVTELMIQKFGVATSWAGTIMALLPLGNMIMTPFFGSIYDRRGRGATIMLIGAVLLTIVHLLFAIPAISNTWMAITLMIILGAAFSLVPSAMWPSVPKIIPYQKLGTAYAVIFWVQNIGLACVPLLIGTILDKYCIVGKTTIDNLETNLYDYTIPMIIFASFGILSIIFALLLRHEDKLKHYGLELPNVKK